MRDFTASIPGSQYLRHLAVTKRKRRQNKIKNLFKKKKKKKWILSSHSPYVSNGEFAATQILNQSWIMGCFFFVRLSGQQLKKHIGLIPLIAMIDWTVFDERIFKFELQTSPIEKKKCRKYFGLVHSTQFRINLEFKRSHKRYYQQGC